jgi:dTMP kinase
MQTMEGQPIRHASQRGVLIAFEGIDGAGKSTQLRRLAKSLRAADIQVVVTDQLSTTDVGRRIREFLLISEDKLVKRSELLLQAAERAHVVASVIRPALDAGSAVLTDSLVDSSIAYQRAATRFSVADIEWVSRWAAEDLVPDLTVLLDISPVVGCGRVASFVNDPRKRMLRLMRAELLNYADRCPGRYVVIDGGKAPDDVEASILKAISSVIARMHA